MPAEYRVALLGFSAFERDALKSFFRLAVSRTPAYALVESIGKAAFIVADADHPAYVEAVQAAKRAGDTVFVGAHAPEGAMARLARPIDPVLILRELDALAGVPPEADATAAATPPAKAAIRPLELTVAVAAQPADVLIVDDSDIARRFLAMLVERLGLTPTLAATSGEAIELLAQRHYTFVLLDVALGDDSEMDGLMLCQHIKHPHSGRKDTAATTPRVVLVTAAAHAADRVRGSLAGCDAYLTKPLDEGLLSQTLASLEPAVFGTSMRRRPGHHRPPHGK